MSVCLPQANPQVAEPAIDYRASSVVCPLLDSSSNTPSLSERPVVVMFASSLDNVKAQVVHGKLICKDLEAKWSGAGNSLASARVKRIQRLANAGVVWTPGVTIATAIHR